MVPQCITAFAIVYLENTYFSQALRDPPGFLLGSLGFLNRQFHARFGLLALLFGGAFGCRGFSRCLYVRMCSDMTRMTSDARFRHKCKEMLRCLSKNSSHKLKI